MSAWAPASGLVARKVYYAAGDFAGYQRRSGRTGEGTITVIEHDGCDFRAYIATTTGGTVRVPASELRPAHPLHRTTDGRETRCGLVIRDVAFWRLARTGEVLPAHVIYGFSFKPVTCPACIAAAGPEAAS
jgi:hypothetical protein